MLLMDAAQQQRWLSASYRHESDIHFLFLGHNSLFDQSKGHRITKVLTLIGPDTADDDHNQAEYHQCKDEKKPDDDKAQRNRNYKVKYQGDLKVEGFLGLFDHKIRFMFLYLPDNDGGDEFAADCRRRWPSPANHAQRAALECRGWPVHGNRVPGRHGG